MISKTKLPLTWVATATAAGQEVTLFADESMNESPD